MAKNDNLTDFLTDIADAIRTRYDSSELISPQAFVSMVAALGDISVSTPPPIQPYRGLTKIWQIF